MSIECRLCGPVRPRLAVADGGFAYLRHLGGTHRVEEPGRLLPRLFDPTTASFSYKRLRGEHEDLYHDPLVNLNPQVAASKYRRKSSSGGDCSDIPPLSHACIVCSRAFASSEEVQRHLLVAHVIAAATTAVAAADDRMAAPTVIDQPVSGETAVKVRADRKPVSCQKSPSPEPVPTNSSREGRKSKPRVFFWLLLSAFGNTDQ